MTKKAGSSSRKPSKKAAQQKKHSAARSYSLEDVLHEYRSGPVAPSADPSASSPENAPNTQALQEEVSSFASDMRDALRAEEKQLPEPVPVRKETAKRSAHSAHSSSKAKTAPADAAHKGKKVPKAPTREKAADKTPSQREKYRPGGSSRNPFRRLYGWFLGQVAASAIKRRLKAAAGEPDALPKKELTALEAAKVYASQLPAFFRRSRSSALFTLLCVWIALAWGANISIPGALSEDILTASWVSMILLLTVMLMGLDVITVGIFSALGGVPCWETLLSVGCIGSVIDCVSVIVSKNSSAPLPPCAVCCAGLTFALRGSWYRCRSMKSAFLTLHKNKNAFTVHGKKLPLREGKFFLKSRQSTAGFIRRSEEGDIVERLGYLLSPIFLISVPLLSLLVSVLRKDITVLPHSFALLSSLCGCWSALLSLPMLMSSAGEHLAKKGAALGGWQGVEELGDCSHLIVTESELFPEGTTAFRSIRILEAQDTEQVISCTGSLIAALGSDLAQLFGDLMERSGGRTVSVLGFTAEDGGVHGVIDGTEVHVGNVGYMYLCGVKIDPKLIGDTVIYTAFDGILVGAFGIEYTPEPAVAASLQRLRKNSRKPVFAPLNFHIDAQLVETLFRCPCDDFEFSAFQNRPEGIDSDKTLSGVAAAVVSSCGLDTMSTLFEAAHVLFRCGRILRLLCLLSSLLGVGLGFVFCLKGMWQLLSTARLLLYMLFWLLPALAMNAKSWS